MLSPKKLRCVIFTALATSALLGPSLVWMMANFNHGLDEEATNLQNINALAREDRSFFNSRGVQYSNSIEDYKTSNAAIISTSGGRSLSTDPRKSTYDRKIIIRRNITSTSKESVMDCHWANRTTPESRYYLTAVVLLRIYKEDKANLTTRELKQWLEYMRYIGVEHVYLYDAFVTEDEAQMSEIKLFLQNNYVTYIDWHVHNPYTIAGTQVSAYQHCIDHFGQETTWQTAIDIDEYPFSPVDTKPGFLPRFLKHFSDKHPAASEICMQNFLFLGKPLPLEFLIERIWRRDPKPSNPLVKPIYKPTNVRAQVHHNHLKVGITMNAPADQLRMNHYWGARLQNWGEDTPEIIAKTIEDRSMEDIVKAFKQCELYVRPYLR